MFIDTESTIAGWKAREQTVYDINIAPNVIYTQMTLIREHEIKKKTFHCHIYASIVINGKEFAIPRPMDDPIPGFRQRQLQT